MSDPVFFLASYACDSGSFTALVTGERVFELDALHRAYLDSIGAKRGSLTSTRSVLELLEDWKPNFDALQSITDFVHGEGFASDRFAAALRTASELWPLPPVLRPSKILNCAANYSGHLAEMRRYTQTGGDIDPAKLYRGDKSTAQPYLFLKAPSSLVGANDDIEMPEAETQLDWEAELGVVMANQCRKVSAAQALEHVAGYLTFNDVTCRDQLFRQDRPNFRTDWLSSKSYDTFGPAGPYLVPRQFVANHGALRLQLKVNGEIKQDGLAGDMIFSPEEQIEYASRSMTLLPGDIFATGTLAGVGQGTGTFLKPGDIVEAEVVGLGKQRNRVIAPRP